MKATVSIFFFLTLLSFSAFTHAETVNEASVNKFMNTIDQATADKDANAVINYMSNDVEIIMNINTGGQKQVINPSRDKYLEMLKQGWAVYKNYEYSRTNTKITIASPRKAFVSSDINESMVINEQIIKGHSKEKMVLELVNDRILITKITTYISM
ncbi:MAG: hypothetical protein OEY89_01610 [Gammaproteobacteria bacterium]|nr:hypothetical protein [Gammaproteobacteria bacterium]